jgi:hypothetical protein
MVIQSIQESNLLKDKPFWQAAAGPEASRQAPVSGDGMTRRTAGIARAPLGLPRATGVPSGSAHGRAAVPAELRR